MKVALFVTCLTENFFPRQAIATVKVLERLGCTVSFPPAQTCCGQPMYNNGFHAEARRLAARMVRLFDGADWIITPSGSCAAMIHDYYPQLLERARLSPDRVQRFVARTREFCEFLVHELKVDLRALGVRSPGRATYHYSCHLRGLGITDEAIQLIRQIDGLDFVPLENAEQCCGFGGTFAVKYANISGALVRDKAACIQRTGATTVISNEAGCTMNMAGACHRAGSDVPFKSIAEIIAESLGLLSECTNRDSK